MEQSHCYMEKDHFLETLITGEMTAVQVMVGLDEDWEQVPRETELGVINVGNIQSLHKGLSLIQRTKGIRATSASA